ncbi:MAG: hypothetical protein R3328_00490 [Planococcaceae bacterium]|nr:hypothetical protein [Planococcaceae bacterium]
MSQNNWNEQKIEQLLSQMPKPSDSRSKEDVFKRLQQEIDTSIIPEKKRKYWAPPAVGVAAMITLTLLGVTYINNSSSNDEMAVQHDAKESASTNADDSSSMLKMNEEAETSSEMSTLDNSNEEPVIAMGSSDMEFSKAVYEKDVQNYTPFQIGLAGDQANSVPVTILIPNEMIQKDFANDTPSQLEVYQQYAPLINEEALGFSEYHPYKGEFEVEEDSLIHVIPENHDYDLASATTEVYGSSLKYTFDEYKEIRFQNEDGSTVEFDQVGKPKEPMTLTKDKLMKNYYLFTSADGREYLSPSFGQSFETIAEALEAMKTKPNDIYTTVIPRGVKYEVQEQDKVVRITFAEPLDLEAMDSKVATHLIEGILLTGGSFQQSIQFENVVQSNWNGFDFTKPMPIPIGPNKMYYENIQ